MNLDAKALEVAAQAVYRQRWSGPVPEPKSDALGRSRTLAREAIAAYLAASPGALPDDLTDEELRWVIGWLPLNPLPKRKAIIAKLRVRLDRKDDDG